MPSNDSTYTAAGKNVLARIHPDVMRVNPVAYRTGAVTWVHVVHPSGASGRHVSDWLEGKAGVQAEKRDAAIKAVDSAGIRLS